MKGKLKSYAREETRTPTRLLLLAPEASVSTNFTIRAIENIITDIKKIFNAV